MNKPIKVDVIKEPMSVPVFTKTGNSLLVTATAGTRKAVWELQFGTGVRPEFIDQVRQLFGEDMAFATQGCLDHFKGNVELKFYSVSLTGGRLLEFEVR